MKFNPINILDKINLLNKEKKDFIKINKSKKKVYIFIIFILLIEFSLLICFLKLKKKEIQDILKRENKPNKYSIKEFKEYNEYIKKINTKNLYEFKKNISIYIKNLIIQNCKLKNKESFYLEKIKSFDKNLLKEIIKKKIYEKQFLKKIKQTFTKKGYVNINEVESKFPEGRHWQKNNHKNTINIGFQLDPSYILPTMMTLASIIDSQKPTTKLRFHFAVVLGFNEENMFKIYSLREKIREDVEFIFYNAKKVETDFKGIHPKGPGAVAKALLPHLLSDDIDRILIFDSGDVLVLRDLTEMYNWNFSNYLYLGTPDPRINI